MGPAVAVNSLSIRLSHSQIRACGFAAIGMTRNYSGSSFGQLGDQPYSLALLNYARGARDETVARPPLRSHML